MMTPQIALKSITRLLGVVFCLSFFVNVFSLALPLYTMQIFDHVLTSRSLDTLWAITAVAVFIVGCYGVLDAARNRIMLGIDRWLETNLFSEITRTRLDRAAEGRRDGQRGGLVDLHQLRQFFSGPSILSVLDTLWSPMFLAVAFMIHPVIGFIGTAGAIGLILLSIITELTMRGPQRVADVLRQQTAEQTESAARSAEVVAALGMGPAILGRIKATADEARDQRGRANSRSRTILSVTKSFRHLIQIATMGVGMWLVLDSHMTTGAVFAASMIMGRALAPFEQMQRTWTTVVSARQSYRKLQSNLSDTGRRRSTISYPAPTGAVSVEGVGFVARPGERPILQGISFSLKPGEALGIVGPSAAGKSTLARLLTGVWKPTAGKVRLDGVDVASWDRVDFGPHIGYVPQDVELLPGTVRENIARFSDAEDAQVISAAKAANAHDMIVRLPNGYDTEVGEGGMLLSGGQRQRIALARALFGDPAYIVLDEPNANLDSEGEAAMLDALQEVKARGATVVIVAHRPSVLGFADKLLVLKDGRVDMFGERQTLITRLQPRPTVVPSISTAQDAGASHAIS